jgi:hypothetical protein
MKKKAANKTKLDYSGKTKGMKMSMAASKPKVTKGKKPKM